MAMRFYLLLASGVLYAQQVVAPTPDPVGPARGEDVGNYNVTNSFETGYRFALIGGDEAKYRSDVNYGNGIRLLGSSLSVNSKDGHGVFYDQILLNTLGLGNDPYQSVSLRVQKNGLYRYDMLWRLDDFYNPGLVGANLLDQMDTQRRLQDHDLTLFPQSQFKVRVGYSRNDLTGPALSSVQEFNSAGAVYPLFQNVRREWNEYRIGAEGEFAGFKFTVQHRWDFFKDDPVFSNAGGLTQFTRTNPYHGASPGWFGDLFTNRKRWGMNARMTYVGGEGNFALNELASGISAGAAATQQILISGNAQRPDLAGDLSLNFYPTDRLTLVNNTAVHNMRVVGDSNFIEFTNPTALSTSVNFEYMSVRTVANATDLNYRVTPWIGFYAGYHYSDRLINTIDGGAVTGPLRDFAYGRSNHLNAGVLGVQLRPIKPLTIRLNGEVGRDNQPLTPISQSSYHILGGRADYRTRQLQLSASYSQVYNVNSPSPLTPFSSHSRDYSANASWAPTDRFSLDASYTKLHLDTVSGLAFFAGDALQTFPTIYISNIHAGNFGAHLGLAPRVNLYVGYSITKDTGDGRGSAVLPEATGAVQTLFSSVQTFPLTYQSPLARLSIRITPKIRWNAGWQFYRYREEFGLVSFLQNYRAHTGYTSVLWSF
ncbi:MAG TPA: hypothetical protein VG096_08145 [Bryobacteraceae bacterium]|jgi:hypothetical protein|nr:hypothetical protein [Bryobacteraceae bacterium]